MAARDVLKNLVLWVDGKGMAGQVQDFTPPKLTQKNEEFQGGGMMAPIAVTVGMERLTASFSLISFDADVLALFGVAEGSSTSLTVRGALESFDGTITPVQMTMRGKVTELDNGDWKPGTVPYLKVQMELNYYKLTHNGNVTTELDIENMIMSVNGTDSLTDMRTALGL
jgi:P2 family phage contractile tail tube protein